MMKIRMILAVVFIFTIKYLMLQTIQEIIIYDFNIPIFFHRPLPFITPLSIHKIIPQKNKLEREENISGLLQVTVVELYLMERDGTIKIFGLLIDLMIFKRRYTTVKYQFMTTLKLILDTSLITTDVFAIILPHINYYDSCLFCWFLTMITEKDRRFMQ